MKNHGDAVHDNAETLSEVPILCDPNSPNYANPVYGVATICHQVR